MRSTFAAYQLKLVPINLFFLNDTLMYDNIHCCITRQTVTMVTL